MADLHRLCQLNKAWLTPPCIVMYEFTTLQYNNIGGIDASQLLGVVVCFQYIPDPQRIIPYD